MERPINPPPEARRRLMTGSLADAALPIVAVVVTALTVGVTLVAAGDTLGYDFQAYRSAAARVIDGRPLYDLTYDLAGPHGLFLYPPPFVLLALPFALLAENLATAAWLAGLLAAFGVAVALLPVAPRVRWVILLLAGLSWPFVYAIKLGQVGPLLVLAFVVGWRWIDRRGVVGVAAALGTMIKLQPALVLVWALLTGRTRAVGLGLAAIAVVSVVVTPLVGVGAWADFVTLLLRVSDPIVTPHNFTLAAVAYQMGVARDAAWLMQLAGSVVAVGLILVAATRGGAVPSYLATVVASQMISPIMWDHYAVVLLVPVAWLIGRGRWWAAAVPLATSIPLVGLVPPLVYPLAFWVTFVILIAEAMRGGRRSGAGLPQPVVQ